MKIKHRVSFTQCYQFCRWKHENNGQQSNFNVPVGGDEWQWWWRMTTSLGAAGDCYGWGEWWREIMGALHLHQRLRSCWADLLSLCIYIVVDVIVERWKGRSTFASVVVSPLDNFFGIDVDVEWCRSTIASVLTYMQSRSHLLSPLSSSIAAPIGDVVHHHQCCPLPPIGMLKLLFYLLFSCFRR